MRMVMALGGNVLLRRSDPMTTKVQRQNVDVAAKAIAPLTLAKGARGLSQATNSRDTVPPGA
jgi:carbamate kinase